MRFLILMLSLVSLSVLTGCKSDNQILGRPFIIKDELQISTKPYKVITFENGQSVLRSKLMAQLVHLHLIKKAEITSEVVIKMNDELALQHKFQGLSEYEQEEYFKKSMQAARVVVAFTNHLEVYFVPAGLAQNQLFNLLDLKAEQGHKLIFVNETKDLTNAGKVFYIISTNKKELIDFDNTSFFKVEEYPEFSNSMHLRLNKNQKTKAVLSFNHYVENTVLKDFHPLGHGLCRFKGEVPGAGWTQSENATAEDIGLSISANGMNYSLAIFGVQSSGANQLNLAFKDVVSSDANTYDLVISLNIKPVQRKMYPLFIKTQMCESYRERYSEIATFQTKADAKLTLTISGHGDLLNDMAL